MRGEFRAVLAGSARSWAARAGTLRSAMPSAIVLCAGFGRRLRPLTDELPKPLVPVGDRSILEHALERLSRSGFSEVAINVHHLAGQFDAALSRVRSLTRLCVVTEGEIKGTAGGVAGARGALEGAPVLVWNGDILVDPPIDQLLVGTAPNSLCLSVAPRASGEGTVGLDERGHIVRLRGERFGDEVEGGDYVGVLALGAEVLAALPERGCLVGDVALPRLRAGAVLTSARVSGPWTDAGDPCRLLDANLAWLRARGEAAFVAGGAEVAPTVKLWECVVGAGARVLGLGVLERCLVCAGATVEAPLSDAIVAPSGRVIPRHA